MNLENSRAASRDRSAPIAIGVGSVLSIAAMAHHPAPRASDLPGLVESIGRQADLSGAVHGALIALTAVVLYGFVGFAAFLGWRRATVRAGMIAYATGFLLLAGAAIISGFVTPSLASHFAGLAGSRLDALAPALRLCWETNQTLAKAGTAFVSAAIFAWSLALLREGRTARAIGAAGILVGAVPFFALVSGDLSLGVREMSAVLLAQSAWNVAAAWWMARA
jgi:hypothetical protein